MALEYWLLASWAARFCRTSASWFSAWLASEAVVVVELADDVVAAAVVTLEALRLVVPSDEVELNVA